MDKKLAYVCKHFNLTRDEVFTPKPARPYTDARAVLYALYYEGSLYGVQKVMKDKYAFKIARMGISKGLDNVKRNYSHIVANYFMIVKISALRKARQKTISEIILK